MVSLLVVDLGSRVQVLPAPLPLPIEIIGRPLPVDRCIYRTAVVRWVETGIERAESDTYVVSCPAPFVA